MIDEYPLARERIQQACDAFAAQPLSDIRDRKRLSRAVEQSQHRARLVLPLLQRGKVGIRRKRISLVPFEPQPCGQHHAHAVKIGAVQALAHPCGEFELLGC